MEISKHIILMAYSGIGGKMVPTENGYFGSVEAALSEGKRIFKVCRWQVAEKVTKKSDRREDEIEYKAVSKTFNGEN